MKEIYYEIKRSAMLADTILLVGESGVGKDRIALEIHKISERNNQPFICIPIHSLSNSLIESELFGYEKGAFSGADHNKAGKFEAADGGTLYLPEISELPESIQLKLLYFLQYRTFPRVGQNPFHPERSVDVRLIFATNENPEALVKKGKIRSDFYHRINIVKIDVPPLRERKEDIELLTKYFIKKYSKEFYNKEFTPALSLIELFKKYDWPGNVRDLENTIERALIKLDVNLVESDNNVSLEPKHFPEILDLVSLDKQTDKKSRIFNLCYAAPEKLYDYKTSQLNFKKTYFGELMRQTNGNISLAAKISKLTPQGLRKILKQIQYFV